MNVLQQSFVAALNGLPLTLLVWLGGAALGLVLGLLVACGRHLGPRPLGWLLAVLVEVVRGTPFLVQSFLLYYGGPFIGLDLSPVLAGMLALTVYGGAYYSEVFRGGFVAVPPAQMEAARLAGLNVIGLRRRGVDRAGLHALRSAMRRLFSATGVFSVRLAEVREAYKGDALVEEVLAFIDAPSKRGLIRASAAAMEDADAA